MILFLLIVGAVLGAASHFAFYGFLRRNVPDLYNYVCGVLVTFIPFYFLAGIVDPLSAYAFAFVSVGTGVICARMYRKWKDEL